MYIDELIHLFAVSFLGWRWWMGRIYYMGGIWYLAQDRGVVFGIQRSCWCDLFRLF